jgi:Immunoglobulin-like domain of bacterial spore germination
MKRAVLYLALGLAVAVGLASTSCGAAHDAMSDPPVVPPAANEPPIVVDRPAVSDSVASPVTISGTANVYEANVTVRILDHTGAQLARDFTTATCGTGCRGTFAMKLAYRSPVAQNGTIVVSDDDADGDGQPQHSVTIPVWLEQS